MDLGITEGKRFFVKERGREDGIYTSSEEVVTQYSPDLQEASSLLWRVEASTSTRQSVHNDSHLFMTWSKTEPTPQLGDPNTPVMKWSIASGPTCAVNMSRVKSSASSARPYIQKSLNSMFVTQYCGFSYQAR